MDFSTKTLWTVPFPIKRVFGLFLALLVIIKIPALNANSVDPDQTPHSAIHKPSINGLNLRLKKGRPYLVQVHWRCSKVHDLFVCVEVLQPSQPNGVMSSAVSLPYHTFTGQA